MEENEMCGGEEKKEMQFIDAYTFGLSYHLSLSPAERQKCMSRLEGSSFSVFFPSLVVVGRSSGSSL